MKDSKFIQCESTFHSNNLVASSSDKLNMNISESPRMPYPPRRPA